MFFTTNVESVMTVTTAQRPYRRQDRSEDALRPPQPGEGAASVSLAQVQAREERTVSGVCHVRQGSGCFPVATP